MLPARHGTCSRPRVKTSRRSGGTGGRLCRLRRLYFAQATQRAARYGIRFERIVVHLWQVRSISGRVRLSSISHMADLVFVAALCDGDDLAVRDFGDLFEHTLAMRCWKRAPSHNPIVMSRRLMATLLTDPRRRPGRWPSVTAYDGTISLRRWLMAQIDAMIDADIRSPFEPHPSHRGFEAAEGDLNPFSGARSS